MDLFGGIPLVVSEYIPEGEVWIIQQGKKQTIHVHEGPDAGKDITTWLSEPKVVRIVNIGEDKLCRPQTPVPKL